MDRSPDISGDELADMLNDCSIDRIMAIDQHWNILAWNRTAELISGIKKADIIGRPLLEVFPAYAQDKEIMAAIDRAFSGIKSFVPAHNALFNRKHYENHFIPLKDAHNRLIGVMNIMHDVAHRIKAEQQLHQLNIALRKKYDQLERAADESATITWITSNNIKEPLRQLYSSMELLVRAEAKVLSDGGKANLRRMQSSLNRMNLLLDDIIALSRIVNPLEEGTPVHLGEILQQALHNHAEKISNNNVQVRIADLPSVIGYSDILYYLFFHLIANAIRFGKQEASLQLTIDSAAVTFPGGANEIDGAAKTFVRISFRDNGPGFNQEDAEKIFLLADKSPQKYAGFGASLAICRKIMTAHDGFIQAEGWPGTGAAFHCYFLSAEA